MEALSRRPHGTIATLAAGNQPAPPDGRAPAANLVELGYATRVSRDIGYRLTDKVLGLAQGIRFVDHLVDVAAPHMSQFTRKYGWPLYLGTISNAP
jgi:IclR family mhp operon transcriptional activator